MPVEAELHFFALVVGRDDLVAFTFFTGLGGEFDLTFADREADRAVAFVGHERDAADSPLHFVKVENGGFIVVLRHDHLVIREVAGEFSGDQQAAFELEIDVVLILAERDFFPRIA